MKKIILGLVLAGMVMAGGVWGGLTNRLPLRIEENLDYQDKQEINEAIKSGATKALLDLVSEKKATPFELEVIARNVIERAPETAKTPMVKGLLMLGADVNYGTPKTYRDGSYTLLQLAIGSDLLQIIKVEFHPPRYFEDQRELALRREPVPFHRMELVKILVEYGADVNAMTFQGYTPLILAVKECHKDLAEYLITQGADVNMKSCSREIILGKNKQGRGMYNHIPGGYTALWHAVEDRRGCSVAMVELLLEAGADVGIKKKEGIAYYASGEPQEVIDQQLSERSLVDILPTPSGKILSDELMVFYNEKRALIHTVVDEWEVLRQEAERQKGLDKAQKTLNAQLRNAVRKGDVEWMKSYLDLNADPIDLDESGKSALDYAREKGNANIIKMLERAVKERGK